MSKVLRDLEAIEAAIIANTEKKEAPIITAGMVGIAYAMFFDSTGIGDSANYQQKTEKIITGLSPASLFFRDLVAAKMSLLFTKFPEWKTNNTDIDNFLKDNKEKLEKFFFNVVRDYVLYGNIAVFINADNELEIVINSFQTAKNSLILQRNLAPDSKTLLNNASIQTQTQVYEVFSDGVRFIRTNPNEYVENGENYSNAGMSLTDTAFINFLWDKFILLERLHSKIRGIVASIQHYALASASNREYLEQIEDFRVIELNAEIFNFNEIGALLGYNDNSAIFATLQGLQAEKAELEADITRLAKLDLVFSVDKENPSETRIAANNRVQLSSNFWRQEQAKFSNFVKATTQALLLQEQIAPKEDVLNLQLNSISIVEEEFREQKRINDIQQISQLIMQGGSMPPAAAQVNYLMAKEIASSASISEELKVALSNLVVEQEQAKQQAAQQQGQPTPQDLDNAKTQTEIAKNQAQTQKAVVETELLPKRLAIQQKDEEQQTMDAQTRAIRLQNKINNQETI
ncbi:MAG: hypothetical protein FWE18_03705 [Alphaproteobacteria bacterium]|nr:hypothetical protein [Alphaproteobacteria bacterium]